MPDDDLMDDVPDPGSRFAYEVPWGILFLLSLIPITALVLYLLL